MKNERTGFTLVFYRNVVSLAEDDTRTSKESLCSRASNRGNPMTLVSFLFIACFDTSPPEVLSPTSEPQQVEKIPPTTDTSTTIAKPVDIHDDPLQKTAVLIRALADNLKTDEDKKYLSFDRPAEKKHAYQGIICGLSIQSLKHTIDFKKKKREEQQKKRDKIKSTKSAKPPQKLRAEQQQKLRNRAQKAHEELDQSIEQTSEKHHVSPTLQAELSIVHQALPDTVQPCIKKMETVMFDQAYIDETNHYYTVRHTETAYACVGGYFTQEIEAIEIHGDTMPRTDLSSEVKKNCSLTEKHSSTEYTIALQENHP